MGDDNTREEQTIDEVLAQELPSSSEDKTSAAGSDHAKLQAQLKEAHDRALRSQADLENYRKRARRDIDESLKYAATPLIRDLLPVIDNLQRAMAAEKNTGTESGLLQGVQMVADQLTATLAQHNCKVITAAGEPFDPMRHEAIQQLPSDEYPPGTVIQVVQVGYQLHDRVIRPAHVIVSRGATGDTSGQTHREPNADA